MTPIEAAEAAELLIDAAEQYIRTGAHSARALARHQLAALRAALPALREVPAGYVLVKAYEECGAYADNAPGTRADCGRKLKRGEPCERCPSRAAPPAPMGPR